MVAQSMQHEKQESVSYAEVVFCGYHGNLITHYIMHVHMYNTIAPPPPPPPNMRSVPTPMNILHKNQVPPK